MHTNYLSACSFTNSDMQVRKLSPHSKNIHKPLRIMGKMPVETVAASYLFIFLSIRYHFLLYSSESFHTLLIIYKFDFLVTWGVTLQRQSIYNYMIACNDFFFFSLAACIQDPDVQRGWNMCIMGCWEWAAVTEFPWTRCRRVVSGSGPIWNRKHVCFGGEDTFCTAFGTAYLKRLNTEIFDTFCFAFIGRAVIRRPMSGICVQGSVFSPLKLTSQT